MGKIKRGSGKGHKSGVKALPILSNRIIPRKFLIYQITETVFKNARGFNITAQAGACRYERDREFKKKNLKN